MSKKRFRLRCLLFAPGDSRRKMEKAAQLDADGVIFDLEDAVAVSRKAEARQMVVRAVTTIDFGQTGRFVRVNPPHTPFFAADLAAVANLPLDGIVLPKVETAGQFAEVARKTRLPLFILIESALAVMNLAEIVRVLPQPAGLLFGAEDLSVDLGATPSTDRHELFFARSAVVTAAAAYSLPAIDMVYTDLHNQDGLAAEAQAARRMGFSGKMAIHPRQVGPIQDIFTPSATEVAHARAVVTAYHAHKAAGAGVFALEGRMVDRPVVRAAEQLLARAGITLEEEG